MSLMSYGGRYLDIHFIPSNFPIGLEIFALKFVALKCALISVCSKSFLQQWLLLQHLQCNWLVMPADHNRYFRTTG